MQTLILTYKGFQFEGLETKLQRPCPSVSKVPLLFHWRVKGRWREGEKERERDSKTAFLTPKR